MADIPYGSEHAYKFVTNIGMITSSGPAGDNIMSAEWTHMLSYSPGMIAVLFGRNKTTEENVKKTGEFGVNIAADDQNVIASVAGGSHGRDVDKIAVLKELGFRFYKGESIAAQMVEGAALNAECRVVKSIPTGDHTMYIGEVVSVKSNGKEPLAYHRGKFMKLNGTILEKPGQQYLDKIKGLIEKHGR